jgi:hypothetical protein
MYYYCNFNEYSMKIKMFTRVITNIISIHLIGLYRFQELMFSNMPSLEVNESWELKYLKNDDYNVLCDRMLMMQIMFLINVM